MRHKDLTIIHRLESWIYPNAGARISATGFVAEDIGRIAYQTDTGQYWRLTDPAPTWASNAPKAVTLQTGVLLTGGFENASATAVMCGLGALGAVITPATTTKIYAAVRGTCANDTVGGGSQLQMRYGSGPAPTTGAAAAGVGLGAAIYAGAGGAPANQNFPFNAGSIITGLTIGTPYWLDLTLNRWVVGNARVLLLSVSAFELP
jgi:hypothetical protein